MSFSERVGAVPERKIQIRTMDNRLRNRLINYYDTLNDPRFYRKDDMNEYVLDKLGKRTSDSISNVREIKIMLLDESKWYIPYDIIEYIFDFFRVIESIDHTNHLRSLTVILNSILQEEKSGYRMIDGKFVPITNEMELKEIQSSMHSTFDPVNEHIKKALNLYSDRENPDYENSIKESISAVESMCCIITGLKGANATLGAAIKKLKENGVHIHGAMENAFSALYGYTSDENGIRHGGIDFVNAPEEDARYMLVSCSAFVNYLKDKYLKSQNGGNP